MDYSASVDMELPNADANRYERLTIRAQTGMNWNNSGYTLEVNGAGSWKLFRIGSAVASGSVAKDDAGKYNVKLIGLGDSVYAYINGTLVASYTDANPMLSGRVKLSSNWSQVYADNLEIKTVKGGIPYATAMIDGQDDGVVYEGAWAINNPGGGSADNWYRTMSETNTAGAAFTFAVDGSGFAIMGSNNGSAVIDVYVDGVLKAENRRHQGRPHPRRGVHSVRPCRRQAHCQGCAEIRHTQGGRAEYHRQPPACRRGCSHRGADQAACAGKLCHRQRHRQPARRSRGQKDGRHHRDPACGLECGSERAECQCLRYGRDPGRRQRGRQPAWARS